MSSCHIALPKTKQSVYSAGRAKVADAHCSIDVPDGWQSPSTMAFRPGQLVSVSLGTPCTQGRLILPQPRTEKDILSQTLAAVFQQGTAAECLVNWEQMLLSGPQSAHL